VGAGERRDRRGLARGPRACLGRWAEGAGGADVAGRTQRSLKSIQCIHAIHTPWMTRRTWRAVSA